MLIVGSAATAGILAYELLNTLLAAAASNSDVALAAFAWVIMGVAILGVSLDIASLVINSVPLLIVALYLDLVSAAVATYLLASTSGKPVTLTLDEYVAAALLCGGGSAALDILHLEAG